MGISPRASHIQTPLARPHLSSHLFSVPGFLVIPDVAPLSAHTLSHSTVTFQIDDIGFQPPGVTQHHFKPSRYPVPKESTPRPEDFTRDRKDKPRNTLLPQSPLGLCSFSLPLPTSAFSLPTYTMQGLSGPAPLLAGRLWPVWRRERFP